MYKAIIDFGSCAVKIYIYQFINNIYKEVYVIRFKLDLSNLFIEGKADSNNSFFLDWEHIMRVLKNYSIENKDVHIYATSVLRTYAYSKELCDIIESQYGVQIIILEGLEEGRIVATGVISSTPNVDGLIIDLGGGSVEVIYVQKGDIVSVRSYELSSNIIKNFEDLIADFCQVKNIYLVGGILRVVGKRYMHKVNYSLDILHNFTCKVDKFLNYIDMILDNLLYIEIEYTGYCILKSILQNTTARNIIISNYGLKEGLKIMKLMQKEYIGYNENLSLIKQSILGAVPKDIINSYINSVLSVLKLDHEIIWRNLIEDYITFLGLNLFAFDFSINKKSLGNYILYTAIPYTHKYRLMLYLLINGGMEFRHEDDNIFLKLKYILLKKDIIYINMISTMLSIISSIQGTLLIPSQVYFKKDEGDIRFVFFSGKISASIFRNNLKRIKFINSNLNNLRF